MDVGGGNRTTLATGCVGGDTAWSPDGTALIFQSSAACDGRYDLFIVATDGLSPAARLLAPGMNSTSAAWSPDGTEIAFVGREATGSTGLYKVDMGAGDLTGEFVPGRFVPRRIDGSWPGSALERTAMVTRWDGTGCSRRNG